MVSDLVVQFTPEDRTAEAAAYDFSTLPVSPELQRAFASAFAQRSRPGSGIRAAGTADSAFRRLTKFAEYLASLLRPPQGPADLAPAHLDGWFLRRSSLKSAGRELGELKVCLRKVPGISPEFAVKLTEPGQRRASSELTSYTRAEFNRIMSVARTTARRAAIRIRSGHALLARWRAGDIDRVEDKCGWLRGQVLDHVDRHGEVPRLPNGRPVNQVARLGTVVEHVNALHLGPDDAAAFVVLLVGLTGQNRGPVVDAPAAHHRPDGYTGPVPTAIVELDKPRRGAHRHMDVPLVGLPSWVPVPQDQRAERGEGLDLRTPFGVYMLLHELTESARRITGFDRLLVWWAGKGGVGVGRGFRTGLHSDRVLDWASKQNTVDLATDGDAQGGTGAGRLEVLLPRLRLTYAELHQKPVAHNAATFVNDYLLRDRGNLGDYRRVVADTLEKEVAKAKTSSALRVLSPADIEQARTNPHSVAARHGMDAATLTRTINGQLDTVVVACTDNLGGHQTPAGRPCQASFMLCLSCPCARALPHHLPLQAAVHDALQNRRTETTPLRWAQRFAHPHAQLADLLDRAGAAAVADARVHLTEQERDLAERFLNRELDLL
jgi:hypothetical protein